MLTMSEFAELLRRVFMAFETVCGLVRTAKFREEVLEGVARELRIEVENLRAMI